jgi:hypothetical protein
MAHIADLLMDALDGGGLGDSDDDVDDYPD